MTIKLRLATLLLSACTLHSSRMHAQTADSGVTEGLWEAKRRFGPDVRGPLSIVQDADGWRADVAGVREQARVSGDTVSFTLLNKAGSLIAYLSKDRSTISGHWIQPRVVVSGSEYASPIILRRNEPRRWIGTVVPLDDEMTMYLLIRKRPDGTLGAFLRNPERNLGRQLRADRIETSGSEVRMIGKWNGNGAERLLGSGVLNDDGFSLFLSGRGGTFDFRRVGDDEYSDFYPRGRRTGTYSYIAPPALGDGWDTGTLAGEGLSPDTISNFMRTMVNLPMDSLSSPQVHAVLIARHGKLVLEEYFHGENRDKAHETRSAAKSITSTLVGAAIHARGGVTLASPVYAIMNGGKFPDTMEPRKRRITLEHLLSMSSGIDCDDSDPNSPGNESAVTDQTDEPDYYRLILRLGTIREPGEKAVYCSINPHLAGGVLKNASGRSLPDLFSELVARPLGIASYYLPLTPTRDVYMAGGVRLTARSFAKIGQMYLDSGVWKGKRILDASYVKKAGMPRYPMSGIHYGLAWWVIDYPFRGETMQGYFAGGNGGQFLLVIPKLDMVVMFYGANYQDPATFTGQRVYVPRFILPAVSGR
ncbi:MAG: beta-lactamase family protein [Gemmatimonadota bacterium]|nr:beta-lactamase family protein [Gemmatimonadota bacterium]